MRNAHTRIRGYIFAPWHFEKMEVSNRTLATIGAVSLALTIVLGTIYVVTAPEEVVYISDDETLSEE